MNNIKIKFVLYTLAAVITGSVLAVPASAKTLVYCSEASPEGFSPQLYDANSTFDASAVPLFNRLVEIKRGTTTIVPALATSWDISADGTVYTFHLRKAVQFHTTRNFTPTRDLNADDVIFSFMRMLDKNHPWHTVSGGSYPHFDSLGLTDLIKSVTRIDDYTVKFVLNRPSAPFIANLTAPSASITSAQYADQMMKAGTSEDFDLYPVGTGPFHLVQYQKDAIIRYKAFPQYWEGNAPIDNLVFAITPDATVRYQKLKAGECHVMSFPNLNDLDTINANPETTLMSKEGLNIRYLGYNTKKKPLTDVRVRKALNMAIDKKAIFEGVYHGNGLIAKNPFPSELWSYNDDVVDDRYDPEAARNLLAEAGYPNGFKTTLWAMPTSNVRRMAEMVQADWAKIGVQARIVSYEWGEYLSRTRKGEQDAFFLGWLNNSGDPDKFLTPLLSCSAVGSSNRSQWCNKEFDNLIERARITSDISERTRLYKKAQLIFKREAPWATIAHWALFDAVRKEVVGYLVDPGGKHDFYGVDIKE